MPDPQVIRYKDSDGQPSGSTGGIPTPIYRYLDSNGDGTGVKNFIGDYSVGSEIGYIQPPSGQVFRLTRMLILIGGDKNSLKTDTYGSVPGLTTGVQVRVQNDSETILDLTDGLFVKTNAEWGGLCFDSVIYDSTSNNDSYNRVRWTFERSGYPIRIDGSNNERFEVVFNDDFTDGGSGDALTTHTFMVQGYIENTA